MLNGKAITLPLPLYPPIASSAGVRQRDGCIITIDEEGNVISASAVSGHPLLAGGSVDGGAEKRSFRRLSCTARQ